MKNAVKIFLFTIVVAAFYSYVGQMVPQKVTYPPEETELGGDMTPDELAAVGEEIVAEKGTCLTCHTIGSDQPVRFPDLQGIGAVAETRIEGMSGVEYLAESLYEPNVFVVEGFLPGMPVIDEPPIDLSDEEILAVIAYLQSLGSEPTVTLDTELRWQTEDEEPAGATPREETAQAGETVAPGAGLDGPGVYQTYLCNTCHTIETDERLVGPSLHDAGSRMTRAEIYESIMDPDETVAEGYPAGVMTGTLEASGFYEKVSAQELKALVDYIAQQEGG